MAQMPLLRAMVRQLDDDAICISSNRGSMLSGGVNRVPQPAKPECECTEQHSIGKFQAGRIRIMRRFDLMLIDGKHVCGERGLQKLGRKSDSLRSPWKLRKDSLELESRKLTDAIINKCVGHAVSCTAFSVAACLRPAYVGEWLSLVEHLVRDQGVGGSNPLSPTILHFLPFERSGRRAFCN